MQNDRISKPSKDRVFPLSQIELVKLIEHHRFSVHSYDKRLPLRMENCHFMPELGAQISSFNRMGYLAVFSLPSTANQQIAKIALIKAVEEFGSIDRQPHISTREQQIVMYRAYLNDLSLLTITRHIVNAGSRWYLLYKNISQISKSQGKPSNEVVISKVELA